MDDRHAAPPAQYLGRSRIEPLGPYPLASPPPGRRQRAAIADAGDRVRTRQAFLPRATLLAVGDGRHDVAIARPLRADAWLDCAPAAGAGTDRRRGTRGGPVPSSLRAALTAGEPGDGTHLTAHCGRVGIGKG